MKNMLDTIKGKKKRNTIGATDALALNEALEEEGKSSTASPGPSRLQPGASPAVGRSSHQGSLTNSPAPGRSTEKGGKFATLMGKAKAALTPTMSRPMYVEDDEDRRPDQDMPAPTINLSHYGAPAEEDGNKSDEDFEEEQPKAKPPPPAPVEEPYVEDDPTKTVNRIVKAIFDYDAQDSTEMTMKQGDRIAVYSFEPDRWGQGRNLRTKQRGDFPCNRTNIAEVPPMEQIPKIHAPGLATGPVASPQVQRIKVDPSTPVVGSPQVQRLSFFDHLNQDIAYRNAQAKGPQEVVYYETVEVPVQQQQQHHHHQQQPQQHQQHQQPANSHTNTHHQAGPPTLSVPSHQGGLSPGRQSPGGSLSPGRHAQGSSDGGVSKSAPVVPNASRRALPPGPNAVATKHASSGTASPIVGSPQVQRLSFFDHLNKDIAQQERKKQQGAAVSGPTITRIVASEEEYALDERGTE